MIRNADYKPKTDLKDVIFQILYRWRSIVLVALIGGLVFMGYQYYSVEKVHSAGKLTSEEQQYELDLQNYWDTLNNAKTSITNNRKLLAQQEEYEKNSVWLAMDADEVWTASRSFYIRIAPEVLEALPAGNTIDPVDSVLAAYTSTAYDRLDSEEVKDLLGTDKDRYIREMVSISSDEGSNVLTVQVVGPTEEYVTAALDYFVKRIETYNDPLAQEVNKHTRVPLGEKLLSEPDSGLASRQEELVASKQTYQKAIQQLRKTVNNLEEQEEPGQPGRHLPRYFLVGAFVGCVAMVLIYLLFYLFSGIIHASEDLTERYHLPLFGDFNRSRARRSGKGIDKILEDLELKHRRIPDETVWEDIGALIRKNCASDTVLLAGTVPEVKLRKVQESLQPLVEGKQVLLAPNFTRNPDAITAVDPASSILLVEEKHASRAWEVDRMVEMLQINKANVEGCILL